MAVKTTTHSRGRPFKHEAGDALLEAARTLVAEQGYANVSMQAIAKRAGVGRVTVYRRWSNKADLVLHALLRYSQAKTEVEDGPLGQMLDEFLAQLFADLNALHGPTIRSLIAAAQEDPDFRERLEYKLARPRDRLLRALLSRGVERGELPADANLGLMVEKIHGALWYRMLLGRPLTRRYATELAASMLPVRKR